MVGEVIREIGGGVSLVDELISKAKEDPLSAVRHLLHSYNINRHSGDHDTLDLLPHSGHATVDSETNLPLDGSAAYEKWSCNAKLHVNTRMGCCWSFQDISGFDGSHKGSRRHP